MQVALPIRQPVERQAIGFAVIALAGMVAVPMDLESLDQVRTTSYSPSLQIVKNSDIIDQRLTSYQINQNYLLDEFDVQNDSSQSLNTATDMQKTSELSRIEAQAEARSIEGQIEASLVEGQTGANLIEARIMPSPVEAQIGVSRSEPQIKDSPELSGESLRNQVVLAALSWQGTPYRWGGQSRSGIDCSGLIQTIFAGSGIELPRTSFEQFRQGIGIARSNLVPGDLVFFSTNGPGASHVGIYIGNGEFISATKNQVEVQKLTDPYWERSYRGSRRVIE